MGSPSRSGAAPSSACTRSRALAPKLVGRTLDGIRSDLAGFWRDMVGDSQMRWLGPEKGIVHLAAAALVNAVWDLLAKEAGLPLWRYLAELSPERDRRRHRLPPHYRRAAARAGARYPPRAACRPGPSASRRSSATVTPPTPPRPAGWAMTTTRSALWRAPRSPTAGCAIKMKVGGVARRRHPPRRPAARDTRPRAAPDDRRKPGLGGRAGDRVGAGAGAGSTPIGSRSRSARTTSSATPTSVAASRRSAWRPASTCTTGSCSSSSCRPRRSMSCQLDACRLGGVNEVLAVLLLAAAFDKPVCPHAGGVGLCEYVQHLSFFDAACVRASARGADDRARRPPARALPRPDHDRARPLPRAGEARLLSAEMKPESRAEYAFPDGAAWRGA